MTTHEAYFRKYQLSVEQYGEILTAQAFDGKKMPSGNRGFDILANVGGREMRIEVKSKWAATSSGKATVVHCGGNKFLPNAMTHLLVVLVDPDEARPSVKEAWLLTKEQAAYLKRRKTKSQYINVGDLRKVKGKRIVTKKLQRAADTHCFPSVPVGRRLTTTPRNVSS